MQTLQLRPHQIMTMENLRHGFAQGHRAQILYAPCGAGKTEIAVSMMDVSAKKHRRSAMMVDLKLLCSQTSARLSKYAIDHGVIQPESPRYRPDLPIQVCMIQTLEARGGFPAVDLLVIDEAHDFKDAWLQMSAKLVTPSTNSLLVLYDDAQSIYQKNRRKFNFAKLGIKAVGTTSIFRLNYRNTAEVLALAMQCAQGIVSEKAGADDEMQTVQPSTAGRRGPLPVLITAANGREEATLIAERIGTAVAEGTAPVDIAVLCRIKKHMALIAQMISQHGVSCQSMHQPNFTAFDWTVPSVKLVTLHSVKGLEFTLVCIAGLDCMPFMGEPLEEELRLLYVGMTRATEKLVLTTAGSSPIVDRVKNSLEVVAAQFKNEI